MRLILFLTILVAHYSSLGSQWLPLDEKKTLCHNSIVVFAGTYKGLVQEKYFSVRFPERKKFAAQLYSFDRGTFLVTEVIKIDAERTTYSKESIQKELTTLIDGECQGPMCHNRRSSYAIDQQGIWLIQQRHPNSGDFYLNPHPSNPLEISRLKEVKNILKNCKT
jgi:hypothetical protein